MDSTYNAVMAHAYGGGGSLLTRIYGPWVPFMALSFVSVVMLIGVLVLEASSNIEHNTNSHTYSHTYSYDAWWVNVMFLAVFALIFVIPVVNYESGYKADDRPPYRGPADSDGKEPQRPLLPVVMPDV